MFDLLDWARPRFIPGASKNRLVPPKRSHSTGLREDSLTEAGPWHWNKAHPSLIFSADDKFNRSIK
jgi:hypothetical protein